MKVAISAESTIDLPKELLSKYQIHTLPFTVLLGENTYKDGEITSQQIFDYVDETKNLPRTSAINQFEYEEYFSKLLKENDAVVHICLSGEISTSFAQAKMAAGKLKNVYIINSLSLSTGIALQAIYACELRDQGLDAETIYNKVLKRVPYTQASFVVNTLKYLHKGGRCSGLARFGALLLRLKPQIYLKDGRLIPGNKYSGKSLWCANAYVRDTLKQYNNPDKSIVFVTHSCSSPEVVEACKELLRENGFTNIIETTPGATITCHCGPKTIGILYFNDGGTNR